jgi:2-iminobutanoate/2-iminopropanoate deaminase
MIKEVFTPNADSFPGVLSQAVDTGGLVFVSGQINLNAAGEMIGVTTVDRVAQIMKNIQTILATAELTLDSVVKATIYVTDMTLMEEINKIYPAYFSAPFPAREAIGVQALPMGATIEISVIAARV